MTQLKCKIKDGIFPSEYSIWIKNIHGDTLESWADKESIKTTKENISFVDVFLIEDNEEYCCVLLPNETFIYGYRRVKVPKCDINLKL